MTCESCCQRMIDVLYGEDVSAHDAYRFFRHLASCKSCDEEYSELLGTREMLADWQIDRDFPESLPVVTERSAASRVGGVVATAWPLLQKIAAGILILVGAFSILQAVGVWGGDRVTVSKNQLVQMVNDLVVARQADERKIIGQALVNFADEMALRRRSDMENVASHLKTMEILYLDNIEETNHYLKALLAR